MVKEDIVLALVSFWMLLYCTHAYGRRQEKLIGELEQKRMRMTSGKDEK